MTHAFFATYVYELGTAPMKSKKHKEPSEQQKQFTKRLRSMLPDGLGRAFATKVGISYSTLHNYLSEASSPTLENLVLLAKALDVSIEWLATGVGGPVPEVVNNEANESSRVTKVPFLEQPNYLLLDTYLLKEKDDTSHLVALRVTTDVMEPTFGIGAVLIVDTSIKQLKENQLVVLKKGENYLLKRVQVTAQGYSLLSDNKNYPQLTVSGNEALSFECVGQVILILSNVN
ncbi:TPA: XRE family transcriptional regulator [Serratia fonticola]